MNPWGPIVAAMIAGFIAFIGMIITKENKVSEFRQAWVNEFREEIAYLIEAYKRWVDNEIFYGIHLGSILHTPKEESAIKYNGERTVLLEEIARQSKGEIERFKGRIKLRLNSDPSRRKPPEDKLEELLEKILETKDLQKSKILSNDIYYNSSLILSTEWKVVKSGEKSYVNSKKFILILATIAGLVAALYFCFHLEEAMKCLMNKPLPLKK